MGLLEQMQMNKQRRREKIIANEEIDAKYKGFKITDKESAYKNGKVKEFKNYFYAYISMFVIITFSFYMGVNGAFSAPDLLADYANVDMDEFRGNVCNITQENSTEANITSLRYLHEEHPATAGLGTQLIKEYIETGNNTNRTFGEGNAVYVIVG